MNRLVRNRSVALQEVVNQLEIEAKILRKYGREEEAKACDTAMFAIEEAIMSIEMEASFLESLAAG